MLNASVKATRSSDKPLARLRVGVAAAALLFAASPVTAACLDKNAPAAAKPNVLSSVDRALAMRVLQSEMMVAGLSCGAKPEYNAFVTKYKKALVQNGDRLKKHFYAEYGSDSGFKKLNSYVTRMANEASVRIATFGPSYCAMALERFDYLLAAPATALETYSAAYALEMGMEPSTPIVVQAAATEVACSSDDDKVALTE